MMLKCRVVENMKYPMVLGRYMMDCVMIAMDHYDNRIFFKNAVPVGDIASAGTATCTLMKDVFYWNRDRQ